MRGVFAIASGLRCSASVWRWHSADGGLGPALRDALFAFQQVEGGNTCCAVRLPCGNMAAVRQGLEVAIPGCRQSETVSAGVGLLTEGGASWRINTPRDPVPMLSSSSGEDHFHGWPFLPVLLQPNNDDGDHDHHYCDGIMILMMMMMR